MRLAKDFDALDEHGQRVVRVVTDEELSRLAAEAAEPEPDIIPAYKVIPLFRQSLAAGPAEPGNDQIMMWDDYEVPGDSPADFAIRVNGTSMEPYLHDGQIALGVKRQPVQGEVGAFQLDGEFLVKQFIHDHLDNVYLLSLNRAEQDRDVTLFAGTDDRTLTYVGTILMERRPPLPRI